MHRFIKWCLMYCEDQWLRSDSLFVHHCFGWHHCPPKHSPPPPLHCTPTTPTLWLLPRPHCNGLGVITRLSTANHLSSSNPAPSPQQRYSSTQSQSRHPPHRPHKPTAPSATITSTTSSLIFAAHWIKIAKVGERRVGGVVHRKYIIQHKFQMPITMPSTSAFSPEKFLPLELAGIAATTITWVVLSPVEDVLQVEG